MHTLPGITFGAIRREIRMPDYCIRYAMQRAGIEPVARVANLNLYPPDAPSRVREALRKRKDK